MKREIKIRFWRIDSGYMVTTPVGVMTAMRNVLNIPGHRPIFPKTTPDIKAHPELYIPIRSTGMKDRKGVEIWEDDIVVLEIRHEGEQILPAINCLIWYDEANACFAVKSSDEDTTADYPLFALGDSLQVIGNLHENPELLNAE